MDDLDCSGMVVEQTLKELDTINDLLGGNAVTINGLSRLIKSSSRKSFSVADLGCGSGDMLRLIYNWGNRKSISFSLTGMDANPNIIAYAREHSGDLPVHFETVNILDSEFRKRNFDIFIATLFTHHFTNQQLIEVLSTLKSQAQTGIVINDIHRHWFAYYSIKYLTQLFSRSSMVRFDAPLSVLRAFRRNELQNILTQAGITKYELRWRWAFRWQLIIPTSDGY